MRIPQGVVLPFCCVVLAVFALVDPTLYQGAA